MVLECVSFEGRAGRVSKGYCYRLIHRDFWDSGIPDRILLLSLHQPARLPSPLSLTLTLASSFCSRSWLCLLWTFRPHTRLMLCSCCGRSTLALGVRVPLASYLCFDTAWVSMKGSVKLGKFFPHTDQYVLCMISVMCELDLWFRTVQALVGKL